MGIARRIGLALALAGIDPRATARAAASLPAYLSDYAEFNRLSRERGAATLRLRDVLPALTDRRSESGAGHSEYFLGDLWVAQRVFSRRPDRHVDVGSRVDGLVAHLLTFMEVDVVDVRPLTSTVPGLRFVQGDASALDVFPDGSVPSASSVHALEHFGLGRYGDPIDPDGHRKGVRALGRIVAPGGDLYIALPVGTPSVEFNAHRIVDPGLVTATLPDFELASFAAVRSGVVEETVRPSDLIDTSYAVGLYHLVRRSRE